MPKIDLRKEWKHLYKLTAKAFVTVEVPKMNFLVIDLAIEAVARAMTIG